MGCENGEWIMHGVEPDDPKRIKTPDELIAYINEVGFLPLFANEVADFSVEERTVADYWWSGDRENDPWEWRGILARSGRVAYGKFFGKKAAFISLDWLPVFANFRRNGYDFDSLREEGLADHRLSRLMSCFEERDELFSNELKSLSGLDKGFDASVTELQMKTYLTVKDFRQRLNKKGEPYGWAIAVYATPESLWGYELLSSAYSEEPEQSRDRIVRQIKKLHPELTEKQIMKLLK